MTASPHPKPLTLPTTSTPAAIDVWFLASVIEAEAGGESCRCKQLVGEVLENRAKHQKTTISASAFIGVKRKNPTSKSIKIAKKVLSLKHKHSLRFFHNPSISTDKSWLRKTAKRKKIRCGTQLFF